MPTPALVLPHLPRRAVMASHQFAKRRNIHAKRVWAHRKPAQEEGSQHWHSAIDRKRHGMPGSMSLFRYEKSSAGEN